jgi:hypothetical protein
MIIKRVMPDRQYSARSVNRRRSVSPLRNRELPCPVMGAADNSNNLVIVCNQRAPDSVICATIPKFMMTVDALQDSQKNKELNYTTCAAVCFRDSLKNHALGVI